MCTDLNLRKALNPTNGNPANGNPANGRSCERKRARLESALVRLARY